MDIGGINRIRVGMIPIPTEIKKSTNSATDRDPGGGHPQDKKRPTQLNPEQEQEAIERLNSQPLFVKAGLRAEFIREEGRAPHILVKDQRGMVIRHLPYEQIVEIYLQRFSENPRGQLIKQSI